LADENKSGALKISSREELQAWLDSLPPEQGRWVAVAIAARAALRVVPLPNVGSGCAFRCRTGASFGQVSNPRR
jgi:hypothetical protein